MKLKDLYMEINKAEELDIDVMDMDIEGLSVKKILKKLEDTRERVYIFEEFDDETSITEVLSDNFDWDDYFWDDVNDLGPDEGGTLHEKHYIKFVDEIYLVSFKIETEWYSEWSCRSWGIETVVVTNYKLIDDLIEENGKYYKKG